MILLLYTLAHSLQEVPQPRSAPQYLVEVADASKLRTTKVEKCQLERVYEKLTARGVRHRSNASLLRLLVGVAGVSSRLDSSQVIWAAQLRGLESVETLSIWH